MIVPSEKLPDIEVTTEDVIAVLKTVIDPELFIDVWTLGLIYKIESRACGELYIQMTFTSVACPLAPIIREEIREKTMAIPCVANVTIEVVFDPPWTPSEELKGLMGLL